MIKNLLRNKPAFQTVFTLNEIAQLTNNVSNSNFISQVHYYVKKGDLLRLTKGIYALDSSYSPKELANKLRTPSYVSLHTVLSESGVAFQPYSSIFLVSGRSEKIVVGANQFIYHKIKDEILYNTLGITVVDGVFQAVLERALADKIYLSGIEQLDNVRKIDWNFLHQLNEQLYKSKVIGKYIQLMNSEK